VRELIVMAATNDLGVLDPAVIRPGRFDRHIHQPLPDHDARHAIVLAQLAGRPGAATVDASELARRTEGLTPAALAQAVSGASLEAMREAAARTPTELVPLTTDRVVAALKARGGRDRPTVENWGWHRLILSAKVKAELTQLATLAADPDRVARFGVEPPSGVLLYGPPGTGKSTIARVLAAESQCSFYAVSAADVTSMWLGESERLISKLFDRARDNCPSIVFIDEIDAIASARGGWGTYDRQVNQLLQEIDGMEPARGVIVVGATNRKEMLDPALLRGGRLSRHIEIPVPDRGARRAMLGLFSAAMPLSGVDLDELATRTADLSGADLEALCQQAALEAMIRQGAGCEPVVTAADFDAALAARTGEGQAAGAGASRRRPEGTRGYV
jgi:transitional endoplasmic reticulum ATPase